MLKSLQGKLTYANVMSTLCFLLLVTGGTAYAAVHLGKNSVGPKQLKKNAVTTPKIKNEAVTAGKVKKGALTGTQINVSTLATVPSAVSAQTLGGMSADQISQGSKLHCPAGTELAAGVCFETAARPGADYIKALEVCGNANRSLPGIGEMAAYLLSLDSTAESWAGSPFYSGAKLAAAAVYTEGGQLALSTSEVSIPHVFRCVTQPTN